MATAASNLSDYNPNLVPDAQEMKIAIVVAEWNHDITSGLLKGAQETLLKHNVKESNLRIDWVPGSFELPLSAQFVLENGDYDGVICIGSVIRGETAHFDYVCQACALGIKDVGLKYNKPVIFCVLTDDNKQQSIDRSGGKHGNKGTEAAISAIKMIDFQKNSRK